MSVIDGVSTEVDTDATVRALAEMKETTIDSVIAVIAENRVIRALGESVVDQRYVSNAHVVGPCTALAAKLKVDTDTVRRALRKHITPEVLGDTNTAAAKWVMAG